MISMVLTEYDEKTTMQLFWEEGREEGREEERENSIRTMVCTLHLLGLEKAQAVELLVNQFQLPAELAQEKTELYWA